MNEMIKHKVGQARAWFQTRLHLSTLLPDTHMPAMYSLCSQAIKDPGLHGALIELRGTVN